MDKSNKLDKSDNANTIAKIVDLLKEQNRQQKDLTDYLGIKRSVFSAWKSGTSASYKKYLPEIASFLSVSTDYLVGKSEYRNISMISKGILNTISSADKGALNNIEQVQSEKLPNEIYDERSNIAGAIDSGSIYRIPVFESVSAGFGAFASDEILDYIPVVIKNPYDVEDTLAIKVKGDSMYPKIEDGDIIIVRKQTSVDSGSIAVLLLVGEDGLVKKVVYGTDWIELHSINPEYKTKRFDGREVLRLRVVGLVIGSYKTF